MEPRVAHKFKHTDIAPFAHLLVVAELIDFPAIDSIGLVDFDFGQYVLSVLGIDVFTFEA